MTKARDKGHDNQPSAGAANARRRRIEQVEDATTNHLWERRAAAGNESKRTAADGGRQKWAATVDNRSHHDIRHPQERTATTEQVRGKIQHNNQPMI